MSLFSRLEVNSTYFISVGHVYLGLIKIDMMLFSKGAKAHRGVWKNKKGEVGYFLDIR